MRTLFVLLVASVAWAAEPSDSAVRIARLKFQDNAEGVMQGHGGYGSGTVVRAKDGWSFVLTNKHVAPDNDRFYFVRHGDKVHWALWLGVDDAADLALLKVNAVLPVVAVADAEPPAGTLLKQWGYPGAGPCDPKQGELLADKLKDQNGYNPVAVNFSVRPGDSGSGVFAGGKLVAVVYGGHTEGTKRLPPAHCVRLADVKRFLDAHK